MSTLKKFLLLACIAILLLVGMSAFAPTPALAAQPAALESTNPCETVKTVAQKFDCLNWKLDSLIVLLSEFFAGSTAEGEAADNGADAIVTDDTRLQSCVGKAMPSYEIPEEGSVIGNSGCIVSGDVRIHGMDLFDSNGKTGTLVVLKADLEVEAPFAATIMDPSIKSLDEWMKAMTENGCELGCDVITVYECDATECVIVDPAVDP